jgi:hypothetical protein
MTVTPLCGCAVLLLPQEVLTAFKAALVAYCSIPDGFLVGMCNQGATLFDDHCYAMTSDQIRQFPDLVIVVGRGASAFNLHVTSACVLPLLLLRAFCASDVNGHAGTTSSTMVTERGVSGWLPRQTACSETRCKWPGGSRTARF